MADFGIDDSIFELFPHARIGVIVCHGVNNTGPSSPAVQAALDEALAAAPALVPDPEFSSNQIIQTWRRALQQFPGKKGARSSVEAMLKRAVQGKGVGSISPLVDVYNAVSLSYGVPVGGEDLAKLVGDLRLCRAMGGEEFVTYGSDRPEPALAGEVIYADDAGAVCRCWNWRESVRTMLTEDTTDAVMVIEACDDSRPEAFDAALARLAADIERELGATTRTAVLDAEHRSTELA